MAKDDFTCGSLDIAIIGMSGRFSGAESVPEWWDKLLAGEEFTQPTCTEDDNGNPWIITDRRNLTLHESVVSKNHRLNGKLLKDLPKDNHFLIIMIKRGDSTIIPKGDTRIQAEDVLVFART